MEALDEPHITQDGVLSLQQNIHMLALHHILESQEARWHVPDYLNLVVLSRAVIRARPQVAYRSDDLR